MEGLIRPTVTFQQRLFTAADMRQVREEKHRLFYRERQIVNALEAGLRPLVGYYEQTSLRKLELIERPGYIAVPHVLMLDAVTRWLDGTFTLVHASPETVIRNRVGPTVRYDLR